MELELYDITLRNDNLLSTENLQLQLGAILSILAEHGDKLEQIAKKEFEVDKQLTSLRADLRYTTEKADTVTRQHEESQQDRKEQETALSTSIQKIESDVDVLNSRSSNVSSQVEAMEPRLGSLETTSAATFERIEETFVQHASTLQSHHSSAEQQGNRLENLEDMFEKAHVDTMVAKLDSVSSRMDSQETKQGGQERRLTEAENNHKELSTNVKAVRTYVDKTFSTKKDFSSIREEITKFVTKEENSEAQDAFHNKLNNYLVEEMETQKFDIITKMHRLQERMAKELEEVSHSTEVQNCVDKVQDLMGALEDVSAYVSSHHQAIERNASRIVELGRGFDSVSVLRGGVTELQEKMEGMLQTMSEKVKENLKKDRNKGKGFEALGELDGNIQEQIKTLHHALQHDLVPKPYLEDVMMLMKKRIADIEWKVMKRRSEDAIPFGENADKNREFNQKLFAMHNPLLMAQRATLNNLPSRPQSAFARSSTTKQPSRPSSAMASAERHPSLSAGKSDFQFAAGGNQFESLEMRKAFHEGQHPSSKGSAAAVRVFKREKERELGLEIPPELEQLIRQTEAAAAPSQLLSESASVPTESEPSAHPPLPEEVGSAGVTPSASEEHRQVYARPRPASSAARARARPTTAPPKRASVEGAAGVLERPPVPRPTSALHPQPTLDLDRDEPPIQEEGEDGDGAGVAREIVIMAEESSRGSLLLDLDPPDAHPDSPVL